MNDIKWLRSNALEGANYSGILAIMFLFGAGVAYKTGSEEFFHKFSVTSVAFFTVGVVMVLVYFVLSLIKRSKGNA